MGVALNITSLTFREYFKISSKASYGLKSLIFLTLFSEVSSSSSSYFSKVISSSLYVLYFFKL